MDANSASFSSLIGGYAINVMIAVLIFFVGRWLARLLSGMAASLMERQKIDTTLARFLEKICYYGLLVVVLTVAAGQLGINTASFLAILGTAGLAIGLALKDSLANFASGVMLILFKPFKVGDAIIAAGVTGSVEEIALFNTMICTPDNQLIYVPNSKISGDTITNINAKPIRRIDLVASIGYGDDISRAKEVLTGLMTEDTRILDDPAPTIAVLELADSSVNIVVRPWVKTAEYWAVRFALTQRIKEAFDQAGISIPFPQQDVHLTVEKEAA